MNGNLSIHSSQTNVQTYNNMLQLSNFTDFNSEHEGHHGTVHCWIGVTMCSVPISPRDPSFFLHHSFVDKIWADWEDLSATNRASFTVSPMPNYPVNPNDIINSRNVSSGVNSIPTSDVWYAFQKKLLLDGKGSNFQSTGSKLYCYVAWNGSSVEGTIYAGDVQRDASDNIITDNKGGFVIQSGNTDFRAGKSIELRPGFSVVLGATFSAQIVDKPCGFTSNNLMGEPDNDPVLYLQTKTDKGLKAGQGKAYPNPFTSELSIDYNVETDTPLSIELVNALGQSVWQQKYGIQAQGLFNATIPTQDLPKGLYHVLIRNVKNQVTLKVVR